MIHVIQINSLLVWIYIYTYIWSGFGLIVISSVHEDRPSQDSSLVNWFDYD